MFLVGFRWPAGDRLTEKEKWCSCVQTVFSGNLDCPNHSRLLLYLTKSTGGALPHSVTQTLWKAGRVLRLSADTLGGKRWLLVALAPHLRTLFWRGVSPMPESFKGLKSNFPPCNPGAFQTSHAVYWHMTETVQPPSHLSAYKTVSHLRARQSTLPSALNKQSLGEKGAAAFHHPLNL